jgi:hypothetical protein
MKQDSNVLSMDTIYLANAIRHRQVSPIEVLEEFIKRIEERNPISKKKPPEISGWALETPEWRVARRQTALGPSCCFPLMDRPTTGCGHSFAQFVLTPPEPSSWLVLGIKGAVMMVLLGRHSYRSAPPWS